ncbi:MAG: hypothetical protein KJ052_18945 [Candidatus Hydrogenedentes bacterium]|nr:hypothetical protein [Candidatus Hydrogenedentota bacterium]
MTKVASKHAPENENFAPPANDGGIIPAPRGKVNFEQALNGSFLRHPDFRRQASYWIISFNFSIFGDYPQHITGNRAW